MQELLLISCFSSAINICILLPKNWWNVCTLNAPGRWLKGKKKTSQQKSNKDANNFLQGQQHSHKVSNNLELAPQTRPRILAR